jgi:hypothetical protein
MWRKKRHNTQQLEKWRKILLVPSSPPSPLAPRRCVGEDERYPRSPKEPKMKAEAEEKLFSANNSANFFLQFFFRYLMMAEKKFFFSLLFPSRSAERSAGPVGWKEMDNAKQSRNDSGRLRASAGGLSLSLGSRRAVCFQKTFHSHFL